MKQFIRPFLPLAVGFLAALPLSSTFAGTPAVAVDQQMQSLPAAPPVSLWEVTMRPYGWLAGVEGTVGVRGFTAETEVPFKDILSNLDMIAYLQMDVRRDRWLVLLDGVYLKMSTAGETPGRLLSTINVEMEQIMAEAAIGYRLWESDRGFLDVFAGARYMRLDTELGFDVDAAGVRAFSEDLSRAALNRIASAVSDAAGDAASAAASRVEAKVRAKLQAKVDTITRQVEDLLRDRVGQVLENHPNLPRAIEFLRNRNGPVSDAVRELAAARLAEKREILEATAEAAAQTVSAKVSAAKARLREQARRAIARAEMKLARRIEAALLNAIPDQVSGAQDWIDPIIGLRTRYNFTSSFYAVGRADIGGFGVGSDLVWQVYAGVGYQFNPRVTMELGYRHLQMDYNDGGFTYDTATSGIFTALAIRF